MHSKWCADRPLPLASPLADSAPGPAEVHSKFRCPACQINLKADRVQPPLGVTPGAVVDLVSLSL